MSKTNDNKAITRPFLKLTHQGALTALQGAVAKAEALGVPQNITIVDDGGNLLAYVRMDGAKLLSAETSKSKAITAASHRQPTSRLDPRRAADHHQRRLCRRGRRRLRHRRAGCGSRARGTRRSGRGRSGALSDKASKR